MSSTSIQLNDSSKKVIFSELYNNCISYIYMHNLEHLYFYKVDLAVSITIIILSSICASGTLYQTSVTRQKNIDNVYSIVIGILMVIVGILKGIQMKCKFETLSKDHKTAKDEWEELKLEIKVELLSDSLKSDYSRIFNKYNRFIKKNPSISKGTRDKFKLKIKSDKNCMTYPEICGKFTSAHKLLDDIENHIEDKKEDKIEEQNVENKEKDIENKEKDISLIINNDQKNERNDKIEDDIDKLLLRSITPV